MADGRAGGVGDAHRVEDLTLHMGEEKAVRGGGARGWPRPRSPLHEGQHVPEDGEVDIVVVRHLLVDLLDAVPDLFPRRVAGLKARWLLRRNPARWVSSSRKVMVPMPGPLTQSGGRNGQIRLSMLRWWRASDRSTAIVVNILPALRTFTMTSGPMASFGGSAAVRARPEATTSDWPTSAT